MIWQNALALIGLVALALPVFIHLLSRKRAVLQKFPSLRFLNSTRLNPTRSPYLTDIPLLVVRCLLLAFAVLALAGPLFLSADRKQSFNSSLARMIVVDTSARMSRALANGKTAVDSAVVVANTLAAEAKASLIVKTALPTAALSGASAWLGAQRLRGEVVVVSDFSFGAIDSASLTRVEPRFGVKLVRVTSATVVSDSGTATSLGRVSAMVDSVSTRASWTSGSGVVNSGIQIVAPERARTVVDAAERAAQLISPRVAADSVKRIAVLVAGAPEMQSIAASAKSVDAAWMSDVIAALRDNAMLMDAARSAEVADSAMPRTFAPVLFNSDGRAVVGAAKARVNNAEVLALYFAGSPSDLSMPALLAALGAIHTAGHVNNYESLQISDSELARLERQAGDAGEDDANTRRVVAQNSGLSDARWFWVVALVLLGVEAIMRRRADTKIAAEVAV